MDAPSFTGEPGALPSDRECDARPAPEAELLVCRDCLDIPNESLKAIIIGPDSVPPRWPRPYNYAQQNAGGTAAPTNVREFLFDGDDPG